MGVLGHLQGIATPVCALVRNDMRCTGFLGIIKEILGKGHASVRYFSH